jgi:hypothetical protein
VELPEEEERIVTHTPALFKKQTFPPPILASVDEDSGSSKEGTYPDGWVAGRPEGGEIGVFFAG